MGGQIKEGTCAYRQWLAPWGAGPGHLAQCLAPVGSEGAVRARRSTVREQTFVSWGWHCDTAHLEKASGSGLGRVGGPALGGCAFC